MGRVIVIGSINEDITVTVDRLPRPGETLSGTSLTHRLGGKGANQSAAAAHAGAQSLFIGRVGADQSGAAIRAELSSHGVDVSHLLVDDDTTTGIAMIAVSASGENTIILDAGANGRVTAEQAREAVEPSPGDVVVLQGEIGAEVNERVIRWAHRAGARIVFNIAPAYRVAPEVLALVDCVVVNETEAGIVLGRPAPQDTDSALDAADGLVGLGPRSALVTLGGAWCGLVGRRPERARARPGAGPGRRHDRGGRCRRGRARSRPRRRIGLPRGRQGGGEGGIDRRSRRGRGRLLRRDRAPAGPLRDSEPRGVDPAGRAHRTGLASCGPPGIRNRGMAAEGEATAWGGGGSAAGSPAGFDAPLRSRRAPGGPRGPRHAGDRAPRTEHPGMSRPRRGRVGRAPHPGSRTSAHRS